MQIPLESLDQFFAPLVGDSDCVARLRGDLTQAIHSQDPAQIYTTPYNRLRNSALEAMRRSQEQMPGETNVQLGLNQSLFTNGRTGTNLTVGTLKALSQLYMDRTTQPQHIGNVRKNASTALRHTYGVAFSDNMIGVVNVWANSFGLSPRNPIAWASIFLAPYLQIHDKTSLLDLPHSVSPHAFRSEVDTEGQLLVTPRHRRLRNIRDRQCPATYAKISTPEGTRSALLLFMKTIGEVAIEEIYPQYFEIVQDN